MIRRCSLWMGISYSFLAFTILGCRGEFATQEIANSYNSVMAIHDEVMPEMGTINKLRKKIKKLEAQDSISLTLLAQLEKADDGMMEWMQDFSLDKSGSIAEQLDYLSKEKVSIQQVSDLMKQSISDAQKYIDTK